MRTRRGIIGLPVISLQTGKRLGVVKDLLLSRRGDRLSGLRVVCPGRFWRKAIRFKDIQSLGEDAVIVQDQTVLLAPSRVSGVEAGEHGRESPHDKRVITTDGRDLGIVDDLVIDPGTGGILGYQVSGGLFRDVVDGKLVLPITPGMVVGQDAVIVPPNRADRPAQPGAADKGGLEAENGGLPAMRE
ncbi:MAG TPA: PRC-barrel domain-containing protein [Bacillota bacterium]|jgi:uncharacterized protein YrrD